MFDIGIPAGQVGVCTESVWGIFVQTVSSVCWCRAGQRASSRVVVSTPSLLISAPSVNSPVSTFGLWAAIPPHCTSRHQQSSTDRHGPHHRNIHTGLLREVRGVPEGSWGGLHPEEGRPRVHPSDDHLRGRRQLDYGHQDHGQEHWAEIQVSKSTKSIQNPGENLMPQNWRGVWGGYNGRASLQDHRHLGGEHDDHHPERHQGRGEERGGGEWMIGGDF